MHIVSGYLKNYDQFNKKHQIQYIRQGTKVHYFARVSFDEKENVEILKKTVSDLNKKISNKFKQDLNRNIIDHENYLSDYNCYTTIENYQTNLSAEENLKKVNQWNKEYRDIIRLREKLGQKEYIASKLLQMEEDSKNIKTIKDIYIIIGTTNLGRILLMNLPPPHKFKC